MTLATEAELRGMARAIAEAAKQGRQTGDWGRKCELLRRSREVLSVADVARLRRMILEELP